MKGLLEKLKNKHFLSLAGNGIMAILAMVTVAILYRFMPSKSEMGGWVFFQTVFVLLDTFRTGFLQTALIKFYAGTTPPRSNEVLGSVWYLASGISLVLFLVSLLLYFGTLFINNAELSVALKWFGITFLCTLPLSIASWILQADLAFDKLLLMRVVNQGSFIVFVLLLIVFNSLNLNTVLWANLLGCIITSVMCMAFKWSHIATITQKTKDCVREIFHFGKYSVGTSISTNLLRSSDTFIIMFVMGTKGAAAIALYNIPMRLMEIIEIPLRSFLATGMPSISAAFNKGDKKEVVFIMEKYAGMLTLGLFPVSILAVLLANIAVGLIGGTEYMDTEAVTAYRIFMSFAFLYPIDRFIGVTLDIIHQPQINFIKVLVMLATNVIGDFAGLYLFGNINGVALATFFTFSSGVFFGYYWLKKYLDISLKGIIKTGWKEISWVLQTQVLKRK
ncbi:MAG: oligosaccharide flippase family protein [Chitinophagaceae bacterium]